MLGNNRIEAPTDAQRIIIIEHDKNILRFQVDAVNEIIRIPEHTIEPVPAIFRIVTTLWVLGK